MPSLKTVIVDYKLSNLFSVSHACESVGLEAIISSDPNVISEADALILPGVGAFADAMDNLKKFKIVEPILNHIMQDKPFMGVCLGLQLLFETSEEFGTYKGLGVFKGTVAKIPDKNKSGKSIRVPHIGWDKTNFKDLKIFKSIKQNEFMYFVHSYYVIPKENDIIASTTSYEGFEFCSGVFRKNVFAFQFHPEKSGPHGPLIYKNFAHL